ncbi:hypothetical protein PN483_16270, partial [Nodularia spumigena CS-591/04]|uniref:hypothetical protein n=1 Tax=Nodularia spumigena TaxID=70799 RepID=UPI00232E8402
IRTKSISASDKTPKNLPFNLLHHHKQTAFLNYAEKLFLLALGALGILAVRNSHDNISILN